MPDLPIERLWRDARVERIWDGTSEIQRHIISRAAAAAARVASAAALRAMPRAPAVHRCREWCERRSGAVAVHPAVARRGAGAGAIERRLPRQCLSLGKAEADAGSDRRIEVCTPGHRIRQRCRRRSLRWRSTAAARPTLRRNDPDRAIADLRRRAAALLRLPRRPRLDRGVAYGTKGDLRALRRRFQRGDPAESETDAGLQRPLLHARFDGRRGACPRRLQPRPRAGAEHAIHPG